jgi:hypothetical protein
MRRVQILCVTAVLLLTGTASADLIVYEYVPGQKVTHDTVTGNYWIWDLTMFTDKSYAQQISDIAGLGTYGNIAGGWHMATADEKALLAGTGQISTGFNPTIDALPSTATWRGRYDEPSGGEEHMVFSLTYTLAFGWSGFDLPFPDSLSDEPTIGAWVTTSAALVPLPGAVVLGGIGLSVAGWKLRKEQSGEVGR